MFQSPAAFLRALLRASAPIGLLAVMAYAVASVVGSLGPDLDNDGIPDAVEIAQGLNPAVKDNDVFNNPNLLVMQGYRDFLGREPDAGGVAFWRGQLDGGMEPAQFLELLITLPEFQGRVAPVTRLYITAFNRQPEYGGLAFWSQQFASGQMSLRDIAFHFVSSPEFAAAYAGADNRQFVERLYLNALLRPGDAGGIDFWTAQIDRGEATRADILIAFSDSDEHRILSYHEALTTAVFAGMLARSPDGPGYAFWSDYLTRTNDLRGFIRTIYGSVEYHNRFLPAIAAPAITSAAAATFTVGNPGSFTVTATGAPTPTFSVSGALPAGVTFNTTTGVLAGTPGAGSSGTYPLTFSASNGVGTAATQSFVLTVNQNVAITSANATTFTVGTAGTFTVTATGSPTPTLLMSGSLPAGVAFNATTGVLSGTPAAGTGGTYALSFSATNPIGNAVQAFTLTVNQAPAITSANVATFTLGSANSFTVAATGFPAPTLSVTGALPAGVTLNTGTGVLSGTPAAGTGGTYPLTFTATNGVGTNATQAFTLTVNQGAAITSAAATTFTVGAAGTFTVTATGVPAPTLSLSGALPSGVTFTPATGLLSGTPAAGTGGTYPLTFTASNGVGANGTQAFTLTVHQAPAITSASTTTFTAGAAGSFTAVATGFPAPSFSATGALPAGVTLGSNGVLSGTPAAGTGGSYPITLTAANGVGANATQAFTLVVNQGSAITSANATTFVVGSAGSFTVTRTGVPAPALAVTGALPNGVTFTPATGVLGGTPAAGTGGTYPLTFTAANGVGADASQAFTLTVNQAPAITSANTTTFGVGAAGSFTVVASGFPAPAFSFTGALPAGVTLNASGQLSGTPAAGTGGSYPITITAANGVGANATQPFALVVNQGSAITSGNAATFVVGSAGTFTVTATGVPAPALSVTGALPTGVTFTPATGVLAGTPAAGTGGSYPLTFTAANGVGANATQSFTLTVNQAPAITSANTATFTLGAAGSFNLIATGFPAPSFTFTGTLPAGVTLSTGGLLSGTPGAGGSFPITVTASNGVGANATQSFTLVVNQAAAITSGNTATFMVGAAGTFTVTASGVPAPTLSVSGTLPNGATFTPATGVLAGTPAAGSAGIYNLTFTAANGVGANATQPFTLTVVQVPAITSANTTTFTVGAAGNFTVTTSGFPAPTILRGGALPNGVSFVDNLNGTGVLSGTPLAGTGGSHPLTFTAGNGVGSDFVQSFTLNVQQGTAASNDSYETLHDTPLVVAAPGVLGNDTGVPAPTMSGVGTCTTFPCTVATANGSVTVNLDGSFTYTPAANIAGIDTFTYEVTNAAGTSTAVVTITVKNEAPILDLNGATPPGIDFGPVAFTEGGGSVAIVDPAQLTVTDADSTSLASATATLTNLLDAPNELLGVTCPDAGPGCSGAIQAADVAYDANTGVLTITRVAPLADYQALLRTLRYNHLSSNPTAGPRDVVVVVHDRIVASAAAHVMVNVAATNNAPVLAGIEGSALNYFSGAAAVAITSTLTVADVDSPSLAGATVTISANCVNSDDVLGFTNQNGISGSYTSGNCTMTLTGSATLANYQAALRSVTFSNGNGATSTATRTVTFQANDGSASANLSNTVSRGITVQVNQAPSITAGATLAYLENQAAAVIDNTIAVSDADSADFTGATVQISGNCAAGEDVLSFTNQNGITGVAGACSMTLSGASSKANYQAALRSVRYANTAAAPSTLARTVSWQVNDGAGANNLSNVATSTINLTSVNDAPSFTKGADQTVLEDSGAQVVPAWATGISAGPADEAAQTLTFNVTNDNNALFSSQPAVSVATGNLTYTPAPNANGVATVSVRLDDNGGTANGGVAQSAVQTFTITVVAVNDAPSFAKGADQTVNEDSGAQTAVAWATSLSPGPADEAGQALTFNVTNNNNALFSAQPAVDAATGTLTYTPAANANGSATVSVRLDDNGGTLNGGVAQSGVQTFMITVNPVNDPPAANAYSNLPAQAGIPITYPAGKLGGTDIDAGTTITIDTTPVNVTNGTVTINSDGGFVFTPLPSAAGGTASFQYRVSDNGVPGSATSGYATVSFNVAGPAIYFVKSTGGGNCTLGNECTLAAAATAIGTTTDTNIFISDAASHTANLTLRNNGKLIGQGLTSGFDSFFGIGTPAQGTLAARPDTGQPHPTLRSSGGGSSTITLASGNTLRGVDIEQTSVSGRGIFGSSFGTLTVGDGVVVTTSGTALDLTTGTLSGGFASVTSTGSTSSNVSLSSVGTVGTFDLGSGALSGASGSGLFIGGGDGSFTYSGTISNTSAGGATVFLQNKTGGTVTLSGDLNPSVAGARLLVSGNSTGGNVFNFSGAQKKFTSTGGNPGVSLSNNTGATINFTNGGLVITTATGTAFGASSSGTVNVSGTGNIVTSVGGTAVSYTSTDGAATFQSISANGGSTGILLQNKLGSFTVTGNSSGSCGGVVVNKNNAPSSPSTADCSGGHIQNADTGIRLDNTSNVSLTRMRISGTASDNYGIRGTNVNGFSMAHSVVDGSIGATTGAGDAPVVFGISNPSGTNGLSGTNSITDSTIGGGIEHNLEVYQQSGSFTLNITRTVIQSNNASTGSDGFLIETQGTASGTVNIDNSHFNDNRSQASQANALDSSTLDITVQNSWIRRSSQGNEGLIYQNAANADMTVHITNNRFTGILGTNVLVGNVALNATAASSLVALVNNNDFTVGAIGTYPTNRTLIAFLSSTVGAAAPSNIAIIGNNITTFSDPASGIAEPLFVSTPDVGADATFTATVTSNTVWIYDPTFTALRGIAVQSTQDATNGCFDISNNVVSYSHNEPPGVKGIRVRQVSPAVARLEGAAADAATALANNNPASTTEVVGTVSLVSTSTCLTAPN